MAKLLWEMWRMRGMKQPDASVAHRVPPGQTLTTMVNGAIQSAFIAGVSTSATDDEFYTLTVPGDQREIQEQER